MNESEQGKRIIMEPRPFCTCEVGQLTLAEIDEAGVDVRHPGNHTEGCAYRASFIEFNHTAED